MLRRILGIGLAAILVSVCSASDTIETVEKAIGEKMSKLTSWSGKFKSVIEMEMSGMKSKQDSDGSYEAMRKGEIWLMRFEGTTKGLTSAAGQEMKMDQKTQMVSDGEFTWIYSEDLSSGQKTVMKSKYDKSSQNIMAANFLTEMKKTHDLKVLADETVEGRSCWTIEATPKDRDIANPMSGPMTINFDKDTGFGIRTIGKDASGKVYMTSTVTEIRSNPTLDAGRFVFKAPEGVPVMDLTQMTDAAAHPTGEEAPAGDKPKE